MNSAGEVCIPYRHKCRSFQQSEYKLSNCFGQKVQRKRVKETQWEPNGDGPN